jgi:hypothetical protein
VHRMRRVAEEGHAPSAPGGERVPIDHRVLVHAERTSELASGRPR